MHTLTHPPQLQLGKVVSLRQKAEQSSCVGLTSIIPSDDDVDPEAVPSSMRPKQSFHLSLPFMSQSHTSWRITAMSFDYRVPEERDSLALVRRYSHESPCACVPAH